MTNITIEKAVVEQLVGALENSRQLLKQGAERGSNDALLVVNQASAALTAGRAALANAEQPAGYPGGKEEIVARLRTAHDRIPGTAWMCDAMLEAADFIEQAVSNELSGISGGLNLIATQQVQPSGERAETFKEWICRAYREPHTSFTVHNMEIAYLAGRLSSLRDKPTEYIIEAEWPDRFGVPLEVTQIHDLGSGKVGIRVKPHESRSALLAADAPDADPNAPWLSEAHLLCTDQGIPQGNITDRIRALRDKLDAPKGEPVAWRGLSDSQWVNIVNDSGVIGDEVGNPAREEAVALAVKLTEARLKMNNATTHAEPAQPEQINCDCGRTHKKTAYGWACNEPAQEVAVPQWQPIETAPKDGTDIMLTNGDVVSEGHWFHAEGGTREHRDMDGHYIGQDEDEGFDGWIDWHGGMIPGPTNWMHKPAASSTGEQQ